MVYQQQPAQPGDQVLSSLLNGQGGAQLGKAIIELSPALPHESPIPFVPRSLARQIWPQGFFPLAQQTQTMAQQPAAQLIPAPAQNQVQQPAASQVRNQVQGNSYTNSEQPPAAQPAMYGYRGINAGGEAIRPTSQRVRLVDRRGC